MDLNTSQSTRPTYTEADVMRLVMEVKHMLRNSPRAVFNIDPVMAALKPFQPDPEAELIEAMAKAAWRDRNPNEPDWNDCLIQHRYRSEAQAALDVLKERDLLKTPRKETSL
jgi:hypothetical protein